MSEIKEYRPINEDERIEIDQLAAKGLVLIGLQESAESSVILDGIKNYLNNFESSDDEEITDRAYELGSLLGNTIQKHYGWNWFCVEEIQMILFIVLPLIKNEPAAPVIIYILHIDKTAFQ